ncbi:hypothetical protein DOY81_012387 [Sarcophaga bullata]|nr:hypothetical protein DOY81_012387 [Sarcophaga bullata]
MHANSNKNSEFNSKETAENVKNNCNAKIVVVVLIAVVVVIGVLNYYLVKSTLRIVCESPVKKKGSNEREQRTYVYKIEQKLELHEIAK